MMANTGDLMVNNVVRKLNTEYARGLLVEYFISKGFTDSFKMKLYPPSMQDLIERVPQLEGKCEIVPSADQIDPRNGYAKIRWDLYAMGNQRLFLGFSEHSDLSSLARQLGQGPIISEERQSSYESTPINIISFICRVLEASENGILRHVDVKPSSFLRIPNVGATFFRHGTPARFEQH